MVEQAFDLEKSVAALRAAREELVNCDLTVALAQNSVAATPEGRMLASVRQLRAAAQQLVDQVDAEVRAIVIGMYRLDGQRKPYAGIEVKVYKELSYDKGEAEQWCRYYLPTCLRLDETRFRKEAVERGAPVEVVEVPKAFIAKEL